MRHKKGNRNLSKPTDQRIALLRSLSLALITNEKIKTTDVRAKEAQKYVERIVTLAKSGTLHSRRQALKLLPNKDAIKKVFDTFSKKYETRNGGYTRLIKVGIRKGDASPMSLLEFV
ncbi:MAG: 50S ribosomal protein L17 [Candidatus Margulisbacteria bacterium]|jgi:large subunit ribosomal protein L17|nr:50S ribosomal protein L17 [Candidatus Margulisiibacteriota bacterium]